MPFEIGPAIEESKRCMREQEQLSVAKLDLDEFLAAIDAKKHARIIYWRERLPQIIERVIEGEDLAIIDAKPAEQRQAPRPAAQRSKKRTRRQFFSHGEDFMTMQEAAERVGVNYKTIDNWIRKGRLKHFKIGNTVRIPREAITELCQQRGPHGEG